ncbi:MAG: hypothetical protein ACHQYP_03975 [Nitrospiria bacterium]
MKTKYYFKKCFFLFLIFLFTKYLVGCDSLFPDPKLILYRPASIKIEDSSGKIFAQLPLTFNTSILSGGKDTLSPELTEIEAQWGKSPEQAGLTELFNSQEIPYLGGDNCLNSIFFDLIGIPISNPPDSSYQTKEFYQNFQGYVKEPSNYFFYNNRLIFKESTFPFVNKENITVIGEKKMNGGANQVLDQYYQDRLRMYQDLFKEKIKTYKINCDYPPQTMGRVREDLFLNLMESDNSFIALADKHFHMVMRKDESLRYISDFSFSKSFFREQLHFKPN